MEQFEEGLYGVPLITENTVTIRRNKRDFSVIPGLLSWWWSENALVDADVAGIGLDSDRGATAVEFGGDAALVFQLLRGDVAFREDASGAGGGFDVAAPIGLHVADEVDTAGHPDADVDAAEAGADGELNDSFDPVVALECGFGGEGLGGGEGEKRRKDKESRERHSHGFSF